MPIDYSKFDNIEDSDEEPPAKAVTAPATAAGWPLVDRAEASVRGGNTRSSGRELLEPRGLEDKLVISPSPSLGPPPGVRGGAGRQGPSDPMTDLADQLERWAAPRGDAGSGGADGTPQAPAPGEPQRVCIRGDGKKKIHTTFPDGSEMVEEYDEKTDMLLSRKSRRSTKVGREGEWVFEVGQAPPTVFDPHSDLLCASSSNPIFLRKDTPEQFQWRIRNLPYPASVYSVTVDQDKQEIVVRTSNKKYFKRIEIPDLARLKMKLNDSLLTWKHQHNTLIISYVKTAEVLAAEQKMLKAAEKAALKM
eukprot:TRINITY_DN15500_c0_g1_i1.p1 TRINITY_DN15500_c0_g1~~TRINITY_DN15500_c0_g1_i1.p1  ORF type:complete len:306 (+),score=58.51 TRINITY_DN15500_c0_g1_i1:81-998(+)